MPQNATTLAKYSGSAGELKAIEEIFHLSAGPGGANFERWTSVYLRTYADWIYLMREASGEIAGYLMGCPDSTRATPALSAQLRSYTVFEDQFQKYPGHLHINLHPRARGRGLGKKLIEAFRRDVAPAGVHIVTSPGSRNAKFYRECGFLFELERRFGEYPLLFMAAESFKTRK